MLRVLVVEDLPDFQQSYRELIEQLGHTCTLARSRQEALTVWRSGLSFDVVLLEKRLQGEGGHDGLDIFEEARCSSAKIILITALADDTSTRRAFELGAYDFLEKGPLLRTLLKAKLAQIDELVRARQRGTPESEAVIQERRGRDSQVPTGSARVGDDRGAPTLFERIRYADLNDRQKENYNFHKVAAILADYGFNSLRLTDDWEGADFIALHVDGRTALRVQLKGRLTLERKYAGKGIHVAFLQEGELYLYPHDALMELVLAETTVGATKSWVEDGLYSWSRLGVDMLARIARWKVPSVPPRSAET